jgi:hypothetical protein
MGRTLKGFDNMQMHVFPCNLRLGNPFRVGLGSLFEPRVRSLCSRPWATMYNAFGVAGLHHTIFDSPIWNY